MYSELKEIIGQAWENRELLKEESVRQAVRQTVELVDKGELRTAQPVDPDFVSRILSSSSPLPSLFLSE